MSYGLFAQSLARTLGKRKRSPYEAYFRSQRRRTEATSRAIRSRRGFRGIRRRMLRRRFTGRFRGRRINWSRVSRSLTTRFHHNIWYAHWLSSTALQKPQNVCFKLGNVCAPLVCVQTTGSTPYFVNTGVTSGQLTTSTVSTGPFYVRDLNYTNYASGSHVFWKNTKIQLNIHNNSEVATMYRLTVFRRRRRNTNSNTFNDLIQYWTNGDIMQLNRDDYVVYATRTAKFDLSTQGGSIRRLFINIQRNKVVWTQTRNAASSAASWDTGWDDDWYVAIESNDYDDTNAANMQLLIRNQWVEGFNT